MVAVHASTSGVLAGGGGGRTEGFPSIGIYSPVLYLAYRSEFHYVLQ